MPWEASNARHIETRRMQELVQRIWPATQWHVGDLAWERYSLPSDPAGHVTALWTAGDEVVGWGWVELPSHLNLAVDPAHPSVAREVLDWSDTVAGPGERTCVVLQTESHLIVALDAVGYEQRIEAPFFTHHNLSLTRLTSPSLPPGYTLRHVRPDEAGLRAAAHRAAWSDATPSRMTADSYAELMTAWPYRPELDWVVERPDGEPVAAALGWIDEENRVGLLEPVGSAPAYRRRGLAHAATLAVLHALRDAGAESAVVRPRGDEAYPIPARLYRGLGFRPGARTLTYARRP